MADTASDDGAIGRLHLPHSRVKKIMKVDKEVAQLSNETIMMVGKATVSSVPRPPSSSSKPLL